MKDAVPGTNFQFALKDRSPIFSAIRCEGWDFEGGDGLSLPIDFGRACSSVAIDAVGIGLGVGAVGE